MNARQRMQQAIDNIGPHVVATTLARASLGDFEATKALLPYVLPKANRASTPLSDVVEIDLASTEGAKATLARIAAAVGQQRLGLDEGTALMDAVGRALERISVVDVQLLTDQIEKLEKEQVAPALSGGHVALSRANGSTPMWGKIEHHPSVKAK